MKFVQQPGVFIDWSSEDRRLVAYPCSDNQVFNLCAFVPSSEARAETVDNGDCHVSAQSMKTC